ncbi:MAG: NAD(+)/NADH kinase [Planctomycetes bacterium]|nr:NAD(+)/NADH kinase [Planctomycetota bacterium]
MPKNKMSNKTVILTGNWKKPETKRLINSLRQWLSKKACRVEVDLNNRLSLSSKKADLVVVFGGDGSILSAARRLGENPVPVIGVNLGKLGFMAGYSPQELKRSFSRILSGNYRQSSRMMIACEVIKPGGKRKSFIALNEIIVSREASSRMLYLKLSINKNHLATFGADGLIVSTPAGSTAHSLAAGGPVIHPAVRGFILTPVCAHTLAMRPLVIPAEDAVSIGFLGESKKIVLTVDGQIFVALSPKDKVHVSVSRRVFYLIEPLHRTFYKTLTEKMLWGGRNGAKQQNKSGLITSG